MVKRIYKLKGDSEFKMKKFFLGRIEKKKIKDNRRKKIYEKIILSNEQKQKIDKLYLENYGKKIPYMWHKEYQAFTGKFDENYFPELLNIPEYELYANKNRNYVNAFADKNILPLFANFRNVTMPKTLISYTNGVYRDEGYNFISIEDALKKIKNIGECFFKPSTESSSGIGCYLLKIKNGIDENTNKKISSILENEKQDFVIQEKIICDKQIAKLYPYSVNTYRIMTYILNNKVYYAPLVFRIGRGGNYVDNAHAGGIFIGVSESGELNKYAFTEFNEKFEEHPDTKVRFEGYKINGTTKVIQSAIKMHELIPQIGVINWDFTLDENNEPVLIEANLKGGGIWIFQMAHGKGPFGENTKEILKWIREQKRNI